MIPVRAMTMKWFVVCVERGDLGWSQTRGRRNGAHVFAALLAADVLAEDHPWCSAVNSLGPQFFVAFAEAQLLIVQAGLQHLRRLLWRVASSDQEIRPSCFDTADRDMHASRSIHRLSWT